MRCRICGGKIVECFPAKEHVYGTHETFEYGQCGNCRSIQLLRVDFDLTPYYATAYGPLRSSDLKRRIRCLAYWLCYRRIPGSGFLGLMFPFFHFGVIDAIRKYANREASILDVGSGYGRFLTGLRFLGFRGSLVGVDPFLPSNARLPQGIDLYKAELSGFSGSFDVVTSIHALEHMPDALGFFEDLKRLLAAGGIGIISIPVADGAAWNLYRSDWVQMDPPRHVHLHTEASVRLLADTVGLTVKDVIWDSTSFQFWGSDLVRRGRPIAPFWRSYLRSLWRILPDSLRARQVNRVGTGDQATFVLSGCLGSDVARAQLVEELP